VNRLTPAFFRIAHTALPAAVRRLGLLDPIPPEVSAPAPPPHHNLTATPPPVLDGPGQELAEPAGRVLPCFPGGRTDAGGGLLGAWAMDEGAGYRLRDASGGSNDGILLTPLFLAAPAPLPPHTSDDGGGNDDDGARAAAEDAAEEAAEAAAEAEAAATGRAGWAGGWVALAGAEAAALPAFGCVGGRGVTMCLEYRLGCRLDLPPGAAGACPGEGMVLAAAHVAEGVQLWVEAWRAGPGRAALVVWFRRIQRQYAVLRTEPRHIPPGQWQRVCVAAGNHQPTVLYSAAAADGGDGGEGGGSWEEGEGGGGGEWGEERVEVGAEWTWRHEGDCASSACANGWWLMQVRFFTPCKALLFTV
jgi:hypothetical protein